MFAIFNNFEMFKINLNTEFPQIPQNLLHAYGKGHLRPTAQKSYYNFEIGRLRIAETGKVSSET